MDIPPAPQPTMQDVMNLMVTLIQNVNNLTTTVNQFIANARQLAASISSSRSRSFIEKPATFDGKLSKKARLFRSAFCVYIRGNKEIFASRDANNVIILDHSGNWIMNPLKMITSILSFMTDNAAVWACPHIEELSDGLTSFSSSWDKFVKQFSAKFEPVDAKNKAKQKLMSIKQDNDLYDRLKSGMSSDYLNRLSYFAPLATDYNLVKKYRATIDLQKADLAANQGKPVSQPRSSTTRSSSFCDPNAMDIDAMEISAARFDDLFQDLKDPAEIKKQYNKLMVGRCRVCGSKGHKADGAHEDTKCQHCGKPGHWKKLCLSRLNGQPLKSQSVRASSSTSPSASASVSASQDSAANVASLKDMMFLMQKQQAELMAKISQGF
ncbi:uncharacterized protein PHACADRAFT_199994 [Phanerochaete carnosa HHB-10118-sp]|uniref:CCHC-type domain-containing protein n=1 Tax=Phanerochaete carnosa (strain HHB-10118-sp) TaxID=650164 RepID=K5VX26_PHACS|nr:uncharacterized protein PHACADRAFT_199994 [Phanerochaete carnosa HHB-10118-sp]EKM51159.1 hypothetical protein PHACADRAFT_199994 [Phanerochaete carnosa HHB-10118-sp]